MMNKKAPCMGCGERYLGCHSECEVYKAWDKENCKAREALQRENSNQTLRSARVHYTSPVERR